MWYSSLLTNISFVLNTSYHCSSCLPHCFSCRLYCLNSLNLVPIGNGNSQWAKQIGSQSVERKHRACSGLHTVFCCTHPHPSLSCVSRIVCVLVKLTYHASMDLLTWFFFWFSFFLSHWTMQVEDQNQMPFWRPKKKYLAPGSSFSYDLTLFQQLHAAIDSPAHESRPRYPSSTEESNAADCFYNSTCQKKSS